MDAAVVRGLSRKLAGAEDDDVVFLRFELSNMRTVVHHCESVDDLDALRSLWVNCLRELTYEVEDWVDLLALFVHAGGGDGSKLSSRLLRWLPRGARNHTMLPTNHLIARALKDLKERVVKLSEQRDRYRVNAPASTFVNKPRHLVAGSNNNVGLVGPIEEVANIVMDAGDKADLKIVSIVGMAGSGKTTLAEEVYRRLITEHNCFKRRAFVSVGLKPDLRKTLNDMLSKLTNWHQVHEHEDVGHLIMRVREILEKKRYLIVVDDLWGTELWNMIKCCFPDNSLGSRIITTTRNLALATECGDSIYNIPLLSENDSRKLFLKTAYGIGHGCPQDFEDILAKITTRCGGLPLALATLGSMLKDQSSKDECEGLIGSMWLSTSHRDAPSMKWTFNLSYKDLPPHLRKCLLYLSIFPENYKIDTARLVRLWIAERFIAEEPVTDVEEKATSYLSDLISRNMVQPLHLIHDGAPSYCKLHPVMYDFIICKSMEENFATLVDDQNRVVPINRNAVHRLSVQSSKQDQDLARENGSMNLSHVRSIIVFSQASAAPHLSDLSFVRVLDLEGCDGPIRLDGLNKLLLLRYLRLRGTGISELPAAIWELRFLETLDVMKDLPHSIVEQRNSLTTNLSGYERVIYSIETATCIAKDTKRRKPHAYSSKKKGIAGDIQHCSKLENLATIDLREHHASFLKSLGALHNLRMITIIWSLQQCTDESYSEALLSSIEKWSNLKSLTIHCGLGCSMEFLGSLFRPPKLLEKFIVTAGGFLSVPKWIQNLGRLSFLQINLCRLATDDLKVLRDLPELQVLILGLDFVPREAIEIETPGFSKLVRFSVNCPVPWLIFGTGAMPKLTHLQLEFCSGSASQDSVPYGIGNLQRLTEVALTYNQEWCANSSTVRMTLDAVKRQVAKHSNAPNLIINDTKIDLQEGVVDETKSATRIQSGDVQRDGEVIARTRKETWGKLKSYLKAITLTAHSSQDKLPNERSTLLQLKGRQPEEEVQALMRQ